MVKIKFLMKRSFTIFIVSLMFSLLFVSLVNANTFSLCLTKGQIVKFSLCNPSIADRYCSKSICQYCVSENNGVYCPLSLSYCHSTGDCVYLPNETVQYLPVNVTLTNPSDDYDTNNNIITFSYKVTNSIYASYCSLYINDVFAASNSSRISSTTNNIQKSLNPGNYSWYIECITKDGNSSVSEERIFSVQSGSQINQPLTSGINVTLISPGDNSSLGFGIVSFIYNISNITDIYQCNLVANGNTLASANASLITTNENNFALNMSNNATYNWNVNCIDKSLKNWQSGNRVLTISENVVTLAPAPSDGTGGGGGGDGGGGGGSGGVLCSNKWKCGKWNECKNSVQTRACSYNASKCKPEETKPAESRSCEIKIVNETATGNQTIETSNLLSNLITGASVALSNPGTFWGSIIVIIICIMIAYFLLKKKKIKGKDNKDN